MVQIHAIGEPDNDSERRVLRELAAALGDEYDLLHNFEVTTRRGFAYEIDALVVGPWAVYLLEVKGYRGRISGDASRWRLEPGGASHPNPIPLANRKCRVLHDNMADKDRGLHGTLVVGLIVLADEQVRVGNLRDDRRDRVLGIPDAIAYIQDRDRLPFHSVKSIASLRKRIVAALGGSAPSRKVQRIGLYDVVEKINQTDRRTVYLARHRYLRLRPLTVLQVYHFDPYLKEAQRQAQIEAIFRDQEAMAELAAHPNIIRTGDIFPWEGGTFVLPHEFVEHGQTLRMLIDAAGAGEGEGDAPSWAQKSHIISGTACGLRHAHRRGVVHRDIRPMNIVVEPDSGVVKLVNFDLARIHGGQTLADWQGLAAELDRRYSAPELLEDPEHAQATADIYSLGLVFYELITGRRAVEDADEVRTAGRVPLDLDLLEEHLARRQGGLPIADPADVAGVIERMCRVDPARRTASLDEVIEDLAIIGE